MRKSILLLVGLLVLVIIGGGLYNTLAKADRGDEKVTGYELHVPYDVEMPAIVIDPAPGYIPF